MKDTNGSHNHDKAKESYYAIPNTVYGEQGNKLYLPFFKQVRFPDPPDKIPFLPTIIPEACGSKIILGAITGTVMGFGLGAFMGLMGDVSPIQVIQGKEVPQAPLREQMRLGFKTLGSKSYGMAKTFGVLTALFGGVECLLEKYRAKHDGWNSITSGCIVGATLSAKAGPTSACIGCIGFAGFSFVIDQAIGH